MQIFAMSIKINNTWVKCMCRSLDFILEMAKNCKSSKFGKLVDIIERAAQ